MSLTSSLHPVVGNDVFDTDILPTMSEYTVTQAARFLGMSEDCVGEFLDAGIITFRLENGERWLQRDSLLEFETEYREGRKAMAEITRWSQEMGLYD